MATTALSSYVLTLADWANRLDPDGSVPKIVEMLAQRNAILDDMPFMEGNLPTGHRTTIRTGLPTPAWRLLNQGVQPTKSRTAPVTESTGELVSWSEVDKKLAEMQGNVKAFRWSEAKAHLEAIAQEEAQTVFYGNAGLNPEEFNGLAVRFSSLSANSGENIISGGGSSAGQQTSMWLIGWGEDTCCGIFPKGSKAGIQHEDRGIETIEVTAGVGGTRMLGYREMFSAELGLCVRDWRYVSRFANIDTVALTANAGSQADLIEGMIRMIHRLPELDSVKPVFYCNRTVFQMLDIQKHALVAAAGMTYKDVDGKRVYEFRGIPVRVCDALTEAEDAVS